MKIVTRSRVLTSLLCLASIALVEAQRSAQPAGVNYITGVVQGAQGPEAGVWVIAETKDLPTNFIKIVVTDDQGRFMLPDLPAANYRVWVRGYGLVDSMPIQAKPSAAAVALRAAAAKTPQEAAKVYPGNYWLSLLEPPAKSEFPGTGPERNVVVTLGDVGDDHSFMHDEIATDRRHPTVNAGGPIYAVSAGHGQLVVLNPKENSTFALDIPTREPREKVPSRFPAPNRPSLHWGNEHLWGNPPYDPADPHNPMIDSKGRVWMTSKIRANEDPSWCGDATNKFAEWFPLRSSARQASFYDPK